MNAPNPNGKPSASPVWEAGFLEMLRKCGNVRKAAAVVGIHHKTAHARKVAVPRFQRAWREALLEYDRRRREEIDKNVRAFSGLYFP